jgi:hypothetical protein
MSKMIQIRNVPDDLHALLKARAAMARLSLSDYLLNELARGARRPTWNEWLDEVRRLPRTELDEGEAANLVRAARPDASPSADPDDV